MFNIVGKETLGPNIYYMYHNLIILFQKEELQLCANMYNMYMCYIDDVCGIHLMFQKMCFYCQVVIFWETDLAYLP